jgi:hypothetical protein
MSIERDEIESIVRSLSISLAVVNHYIQIENLCQYF